MVTVVKTPKFGGAQLGAAAGAGASKGLSEEFGRQRELKEKQERSDKIQKGLQQLQEAMSTAGGFEAAQDIEPFQFFKGLVTDIDDAKEILGQKTKFLERNFPERVQSITPEGDVSGLIDPKRRGGPKKPGVLTFKEFGQLSKAQAAKAKAKAKGKGKGKDSLALRKVHIFDRMVLNRRQGKLENEGLSGPEIRLIQSDFRDPDRAEAAAILAESNTFFRIKDDKERADVFEEMVRYIKGGRTGESPIPEEETLPEGLTVEQVDQVLKKARKENPKITRAKVIEVLSGQKR